MAKEVLEAALDEMAEIVAARFAALGVEGFDPLTADLTWKNNKLTPGELILAGYLFGTYDPATGSFSVLVFEVDGVPYAWGSVLTSTIPSQGVSKTDTIPTYALDPTEAMTLDVLTFLASGSLGIHSVDWASGSRVTGLRWADFEALTMINSRVFEDVVTVSPYVTPTEITGFALRKA